MYKGVNSLNSQVAFATLGKQFCYEPEENPVSVLPSIKLLEVHLWNWVLIPKLPKASEGILEAQVDSK